MAEHRTVTTQGKFNCYSWLPMSELTRDSVIAVITDYDEHHLHHPHRDPPKHIFKSKCPHEFHMRRKETTETTNVGKRRVVDADELIVELSDSVRTMYAGWSMKWEFQTATGRNRGSAVQVIQQGMTTLHGEPLDLKTLTVGKPMVVRKLLEEAVDTTLYFQIVWTREDPGSGLIALRRLMAQTRAKMVEAFKSPSIDITRLVFDSKRSGTPKHLYVYSNVLRQFEYFEKCHSPEYSETQHLDRSADHDERTYCGDSDEEWDLDSEEDFEPEKNTAFKATIHVKDVSRRTYRAFIDYAICGALHFAPLLSAYGQYYQETSLTAAKTGKKKQPTSWPVWAKAHSTTHTDVTGCKTFTSPKSLYRLADMLIIPELKEICHKQIIESLEKSTVIAELQSPLFEQHRELRLAAYKSMQKNWRTFSGSELVPLFTCLPEEEAVIVVNYLLKEP
ncbi:uncharacterized protein MELLADRAFT_89049 [Melampsora larici-populina 98AG31]|uniref:BTB domain-containing protein n=1 Tax=Melampsora larici-populina (strain 98AG31 / pathotype 3-4-7) TaxID=747676 RepID=F4R6T7_MELLP|nr:uncharacterized protein MELLADRAFT_89049 [Melampsora larici-populina 98AG31]EGG12399.1 hypothetical protein MELLADRAFT_89049 [Melampsora larici-populina 98AG31]